MLQPKYDEFFNKFQNDFYKSIPAFQSYSNYDINNYTFKLLNIMAKGHPHLAFELLSIYGNCIKVDECPDLIRALQHNFCNQYKKDVMNHVFWKQSTKKAKFEKNKAKILTVKRKSKDVVEFPLHIQDKIQTILMLDNKDYETLKYTSKVQKVGLELIRRFEKSQIKLIKH